MIRDEESQHRVAQELHAFVVGVAMVRVDVGRVGERSPEELPVLEHDAEYPLGMIDALLVAGTGRRPAHRSARPTTSVALCPPNPKEFDMTALSSVSRASLGT